MPPLSKEQKKELALERAKLRELALWEREQARKDREHKRLVNRELKVLKFMKKTGVLYYHHNKVDSWANSIKSIIEQVKEEKRYHIYEWTTGEHVPFCHIGCRFRSNEFDSIYDVPLDGSYIFQAYDSGERGLGAKDRLTAVKVEEKPYVPYVNPGAIIPIIAK
jgi:hypothetical protein